MATSGGHLCWGSQFVNVMLEILHVLLGTLRPRHEELGVEVDVEGPESHLGVHSSYPSSVEQPVDIAGQVLTHLTALQTAMGAQSLPFVDVVLQDKNGESKVTWGGPVGDGSFLH